MIVTYEFYSTVYGGTAVSQEEFSRYEKLSELFLNKISFGHIVEIDGTYGQIIRREFIPFTEKELEALQYGECNLIETIQKLSKAEDNAISGNSSAANVKSRTSGGESVSFDVKKTVYDEALTNEDKKTELFKNAIYAYAYPDMFRVNPFYAGRWY